MARTVFHRFLSIFGGRVGQLLVGLVITPLLVRVLGSAQYGDYAVILSMLGVLMILVNAGIFDGIRKYIAERRDTEGWEARVFGFYTRVAAVFALVAAGVLVAVAASGLVDRVFGTGFRTYFYLLAGMVVASQLYRVARGALMGFGEETRSEPLVVLHTALFGLIGLPLAYVGYGVAGALGGQLLAMLAVAALGFAFLRRRTSLSQVARPVGDGFPARELMSFNAMSVVLIFLTTSLYHVDILLLQPLAGSEQTGYYKAALVVAEFLWFVPFAVQMVLLQATSELWSTEQYDRITRIATRATRYALLLTLLMVLGLAALADEFVPLYFGEEFVAATTPLLLLLPGALGFAVARPIFAIGQGKGELRPLIYATGVAAGLNLILNLLLIPQYGMHGAAVATSIGYGSMLLLHVFSAIRIGFNPVADLRLPRILLTTALTAPVVFGLAAVLSGLLALAIVPSVGLAVYAALAFKTGAVDAQETDELLRELPEPLAGLADAL